MRAGPRNWIERIGGQATPFLRRRARIGRTAERRVAARLVARVEPLQPGPDGVAATAAGGRRLGSPPLGHRGAGGAGAGGEIGDKRSGKRKHRSESGQPGGRRRRADPHRRPDRRTSRRPGGPPPSQEGPGRRGCHVWGDGTRPAGPRGAPSRSATPGRIEAARRALRGSRGARPGRRGPRRCGPRANRSAEERGGRRRPSRRGAGRWAILGRRPRRPSPPCARSCGATVAVGGEWPRRSARSAGRTPCPRSPRRWRARTIRFA